MIKNVENLESLICKLMLLTFVFAGGAIQTGTSEKITCGRSGVDGH